MKRPLLTGWPFFVGSAAMRREYPGLLFVFFLLCWVSAGWAQDGKKEEAPVGECRLGNCVDGIGMADLPEETIYIGQWHNGRPDGAGFFIYSPDDPQQEGRYEGQVKDGKRDGSGEMFFPDGSRYRGEFKDDRYEGYGVFSFPDGSSYEGTFVDNNYEGYGIYTFPDGSTRQGYWEKGRFVRELRLRR